MNILHCLNFIDDAKFGKFEYNGKKKLSFEVK